MYLNAHCLRPRWSFSAPSIVSDTDRERMPNTVSCQLIFARALEAVELPVKGTVMWVTKHSANSVTCKKCCAVFHTFRLTAFIKFLKTFTSFTFLIIQSKLMKHASHWMSWLSGYHSCFIFGRSCVQISVLEIRYPDWGFSWFSSVPTGECWDSNSKLGHNRLHAEISLTLPH
jgi:hypothetical protein